METFVGKMLHDQTSLSLFGTADDVVEFDDVWMVEHFLNDVFTFDFIRLYGKKDFDGNFSSVFFIVGLKDV